MLLIFKVGPNPLVALFRLLGAAYNFRSTRKDFVNTLSYEETTKSPLTES